MDQPSFIARVRDVTINAIATVVVAGLALAGAVATGWFGFASKDQELRVHLVEIAIGILRADPSKEDVAPARQWAIDIIERDSGVKFTPEDRAALLHKAVKTIDYGGGGFDGDATFGARARPTKSARGAIGSGEVPATPPP
jgi:hypothetical protein